MDSIKNNFEKYKNFWILGIAIVVVAALAVGTSYVRTHRAIDETVLDDQKAIEVCQDGDAFDAITGKPCPKSATSTKASQESTRDGVLAKYKGRVLQLTDTCTFSPKEQTHKIGTAMVIDNNTSSTQTVGVGTQVYTIGGYHYKTFKLPTTEGVYLVDCGGTHTDASILVTLQ